MKILAWLTDAFIFVFGITEPGPEGRRRANLLIGGTLFTVLLVAFGAVGIMVFVVLRH
jgi:hypothetical protein